MLEGTIARWPKEEEALFPLLWQIQQKMGFIGVEAVRHIAQHFDRPSEEIADLIKRSRFLEPAPRALHRIVLCQSGACAQCEGQSVKEAWSETLNIPPGGQTPDVRFSLQTTSCIGMCEGAPAMMINDRRIGQIARKEVPDLFDEFAREQV